MSTTASGAGRERGYTIVIVFLLLAIGLASVDFWWLNNKNGEDREAIALTTQVQVLSQQTAKYALEASDGNRDSFRELAATRNTIDSAVQRLVKGDIKTGMPAYADDNATQSGRTIGNLANAWHQLDADIGKILNNKDLVLSSGERADLFAKQMPLLNARADEVMNIVQQKNASVEQTFTLARWMLMADRMIRRVQEILQGGDASQSAADGLSRDAQLYGSVLKGLIDGNPDGGVRAIGDTNAHKILDGMQGSWAELVDPVTQLVAASPNLQDVKRAGNQASLDSQTVLLRANEAADQIARLPLTRLFPNVWWGLLGAIGAVLFALLLVYNLVRDQRRRFETTSELNQRNQVAIMRLLDEMGTLAEGDLTIKATVTEDITGAIADAMNSAVDEMRNLVTTINETAVRVGGGPGNPGHRDAPGRRGRAAGAADHLRHLGDQPDRDLDGYGVEGFRRVGRRGAALGADRVTRCRSGARDHPGHGLHPRPDPGNLQAHQAPGRVVAGNRLHRGTHQRHRRADQYPRAERGHPGRLGR